MQMLKAACAAALLAVASCGQASTSYEATTEEAAPYAMADAPAATPDDAALRPKPCLLARNGRLRRLVAAKLERR